MTTPANVEILVCEYRALLGERLKDTSELCSLDADMIRSMLVSKGDWTDSAAEHLVALVNNYGSFMLRNALALSLALGNEDGELGF